MMSKQHSFVARASSRVLTLFVLHCLKHTALGAPSASVRLMLGSCNKVRDFAGKKMYNPFWGEITRREPAAWIWMGDNVYADTKRKTWPECFHELYKTYMGKVCARIATCRCILACVALLSRCIHTAQHTIRRRLDSLSDGKRDAYPRNVRRTATRSWLPPAHADKQDFGNMG
jgi:hypothetical protein